MIIILRKRRVKQMLATAVLMIMVGVSLAHPFAAQADETPDTMYLWPVVSNDPVNDKDEFFAIDFPKAGSGSLHEFLDRFPETEMVVGIPSDKVLSASFLSGLSRSIIYHQKQKRIEQERLEKAKENVETAKKAKRKPNPRDLAIIERARQRELEKNRPLDKRDYFGNTIFNLWNFYKPKRQEEKQIEEKIDSLPEQKKEPAKKITQVDRSALELPYLQKMVIYREILRQSSDKEYEQSAILIIDHIREYGIKKFGEHLNPCFTELVTELVGKIGRNTNELPAKPNNADSVVIFGNTLMIGGAALLLKILMVAL